MIVMLGLNVQAVELDNSHVYEILTQYDGDVASYMQSRYGVKMLCTNFLATCHDCENCSCSDTDEQDYLSVKGTVIFETYIRGEYVRTEFTDICSTDLSFNDNFLLQVSCDNDPECNSPKWIKYNCDCRDGTCSDSVPEFGVIGLLMAISGSLFFVVRKNFK